MGGDPAIQISNVGLPQASSTGAANAAPPHRVHLTSVSTETEHLGNKKAGENANRRSFDSQKDSRSVRDDEVSRYTLTHDDHIKEPHVAELEETCAVTLTSLTASAVTQYARVLVNLLTSLLSQGFTLADRELRNDVILLIATFAAHPANQAALHDAGYTAIATAVATTPEVCDPGPVVPQLHVVQDDVNFEFRRLNLLALSRVCSFLEALAEAQQGGIIQQLLFHLGGCHVGGEGGAGWSAVER